MLFYFNGAGIDQNLGMKCGYLQPPGSYGSGGAAIQDPE